MQRAVQITLSRASALWQWEAKGWSWSLEPVVVAGTSASEAARGGGLKAQASVKHRLRTAAGLPRTARTAGVCRLPLRLQCHDASAADSSRARDTAPRDGNERDDTNDERDLAGVVAGGSQPRDRRARREVAYSRTAERHYDDR